MSLNDPTSGRSAAALDGTAAPSIPRYNSSWQNSSLVPWCTPASRLPGMPSIGRTNAQRMIGSRGADADFDATDPLIDAIPPATKVAGFITETP